MKVSRIHLALQNALAQLSTTNQIPFENLLLKDES
jgi:hypothetical protein